MKGNSLTGASLNTTLPYRKKCTPAAGRAAISEENRVGVRRVRNGS